MTRRTVRPASAHRVLLVAQAYPDGGGISSILENYVAELEGRYEVHVAVVEDRPGRDRLGLPPERIHVHGYSNAMNPLLFPTSLVFAVRVAYWLRRLVVRLQPRAVLVQDALNLSVPGVLATRRQPAPVVVMDHGTLTNVHDPRWLPMVTQRLSGVKRFAFRLGFGLDHPWRSGRWRLGVRSADEAWYTGEELQPWFRHAGGRARTYAQTIPTDFRPATRDERAAARRAFDLPEAGVVVNVVGRLDGEKGLDTIIEAIGGLKESEPQLVVLVVGDGSLAPWLRREIERRALDGLVRVLGRLERPQIRRIQHASDLHLYAGTISCGVSMCLLEAMASGVVPIVSDVPAAQRGLVDGVGWVFPAGDADSLTSALREAVSLPSEELARASQAVVRRVHEARDPTVPELLEQLIAGSPGTAAVR